MLRAGWSGGWLLKVTDNLAGRLRYGPSEVSQMIRSMQSNRLKTAILMTGILTLCSLLELPLRAQSTTSRWCSFYGPKEFIRAQRIVADVSPALRELNLYWRDGVRTQLKSHSNSSWKDSSGKAWYGGGDVFRLRNGNPDPGFKLLREHDGAVIDCGGWPNSDI